MVDEMRKVTKMEETEGREDAVGYAHKRVATCANSGHKNSTASPANSSSPRATPSTTPTWSRSSRRRPTGPSLAAWPRDWVVSFASSRKPAAAAEAAMRRVETNQKEKEV